MSVNHSPKIVNNGLIFSYDMYNKQSNIGPPNTNYCNFDVYNYTDGNATVTRNVTPPINPPIPGYPVHKIQSNNGSDTSGDILHTSTLPSAGYYTHSAYVLLTAGTYARIGQHWNPWDYGVAQYIPLNTWTRISQTFYDTWPAGSPSIANAYGTDGTIYITCIQYEQGQIATPFIGGTAGVTRSSFLSLLNTNYRTAKVTAKNVMTYTSDYWGSYWSYLYAYATDFKDISTGSVVVGTYIQPGTYVTYVDAYQATLSKDHTDPIWADIQSVTFIDVKNPVAKVDNLTYNSDGSFTFNGSQNQAITIYGDAFKNLKSSQGGTGFTVILWARSTGGSGSWCKLIGNGDADDYIDLYQNPNGNFGQECGSTLYVDGVQVSDNTFYMINSGWHCYAATNLNAGSVTTATYELTVGNEPLTSPTSAYPFFGDIPVVQIYNRVLSSAELKQNFIAHRGRYGL